MMPPTSTIRRAFKASVLALFSASCAGRAAQNSESMVVHGCSMFLSGITITWWSVGYAVRCGVMVGQRLFPWLSRTNSVQKAKLEIPGSVLVLLEALAWVIHNVDDMPGLLGI